MMFIISADWHLTSREQDEYRWGVFEYLCNTFPGGVADLYILGDLTDAKDRHPASLVNRLVHGIRLLSDHFQCVRILRGNHDGFDPNNPFFRFLPLIAANVEFFTQPRLLKNGVLMLPHSRNPEKEWSGTERDIARAEYVMLHQTFDGARASNGVKMTGMSTSYFSKLRGKKPKSNCYSGDIHVPQRVGPITYVGSPYHVHFGDDFTPRILSLDQTTHAAQDHHFGSVKKVSATISTTDDLEKLGLRPNDQLKVKVRMARSEFASWAENKAVIVQWCQQHGVLLQGLEVVTKERKRLSKDDNNAEPVVTTAQVFDEYCKREKLDKALTNVGRRLL